MIRPVAPDTQDDWLPISAAALLVGAVGLFAAAVLSPSGDSARETLMIVEEQGGRWLAGAVMYFIAAVGLTLGIPAVLACAPRRGRRLSQVAAGCLAVGYVGIAGFASLLIFLRALVVSDAVRAAQIQEATDEVGLEVFLFGWVGAFYLGELLLAIALLRAGRDVVPRWVAVAMLLHVASVTLAGGPDWVSDVATGVFALAFAGLAIRVAQPA